MLGPEWRDDRRTEFDFRWAAGGAGGASVAGSGVSGVATLSERQDTSGAVSEEAESEVRCSLSVQTR